MGVLNMPDRDLALRKSYTFHKRENFGGTLVDFSTANRKLLYSYRFLTIDPLGYTS